MNRSDEGLKRDNFVYRKMISYKKQRKYLILISFGLVLLNLILGVLVMTVKSNDNNNDIDQNDANNNQEEDDKTFSPTDEEDFEIPTSRPTSKPSTSSPVAENIITESPTEIPLDFGINELDLSRFRIDSFEVAKFLCDRVERDDNNVADNNIFAVCVEDVALLCQLNQLTALICADNSECSCTPGVLHAFDENTDLDDFCVEPVTLNGEDDCPEAPLDTLKFDFFGFAEDLSEEERVAFDGATNVAQLVKECQSREKDFSFCEEAGASVAIICDDQELSIVDCGVGTSCNCVPGEINPQNSACNDNINENQCNELE